MESSAFATSSLGWFCGVILLDRRDERLLGSRGTLDPEGPLRHHMSGQAHPEYELPIDERMIVSESERASVMTDDRGLRHQRQAVAAETVEVHHCGGERFRIAAGVRVGVVRTVEAGGVQCTRVRRPGQHNVRSIHGGAVRPLHPVAHRVSHSERLARDHLVGAEGLVLLQRRVIVVVVELRIGRRDDTGIGGHVAEGGLRVV